MFRADRVSGGSPGRRIQDSLVCVDGSAFDLPCLPVKELVLPSGKFKQLHLEIRAVHMDVKSLRLSCNSWQVGK